LMIIIDLHLQIYIPKISKENLEAPVQRTLKYLHEGR
jgi:hypothetical protein